MWSDWGLQSPTLVPDTVSEYEKVTDFDKRIVSYCEWIWNIIPDTVAGTDTVNEYKVSVARSYCCISSRDSVYEPIGG